MVAEQQEAEIVKAQRYDDDSLRKLETLDDIKNLIGGDIGSASDLGSGFAILEGSDKDRLCNVPLVFISWNFSKGDFGDFVSANVVQVDKRSGNIVGKFILNDGSTGIMQQLKEYTNRTGQYSLIAPRGLRRSDYTVDLPDPKTGELKATPASTYYIDTTPDA